MSIFFRFETANSDLEKKKVRLDFSSFSHTSALSWFYIQILRRQTIAEDPELSREKSNNNFQKN